MTIQLIVIVLNLTDFTGEEQLVVVYPTPTTSDIFVEATLLAIQRSVLFLIKMDLRIIL